MEQQKKRISLDWWTVITAAVIAALVLGGILPAIPW